jgi:hypothetical protein
MTSAEASPLALFAGLACEHQTETISPPVHVTRKGEIVEERGVTCVGKSNHEGEHTFSDRWSKPLATGHNRNRRIKGCTQDGCEVVIIDHQWEPGGAWDSGDPA